MRYHISPFTCENTPIYEQVDSIVLIGVAHGANAERQREKRAKFLAEIYRCDHLLLEGNHAVSNMNALLLPTNYETTARRVFRDPAYFLEEDADIPALGEKYGVRKDLFDLYDSLQILRAGLQVCNDNPEILARMLMNDLEVKRRLYRGFDAIHPEETLRKIGEMLRLFPEEEADVVCGIGEIFEWYKARVRDHELLGPRTRNLLPRLRGRKGEIVGANHVDYLARYLRGQATGPPEDWRSFAQGLDPQQRNVIRRIEEELFPSS